MNNRIVTISREFGSGGRLVGERVAEKLGFAFFDRALIHLAAQKSGLAPQIFEKAEEDARSRFLFNLSIGGYASAGVLYSQVGVPISDQAFFAQSKVIEELAEKGGCVIIGRCANYILRNHPRCLRVFIYAPVEERLLRIVQDYGVPKEEAESRLQQMDKGRANYYEHYTNEKWSSLRMFDIAINTACAGIDGAAQIICDLAESREFSRKSFSSPPSGEALSDATTPPPAL